MQHVCWSVKGGSGTTVVATTMALLAAQQMSLKRRGAPASATEEVLLIDLGGDVPSVLGRTVRETTGVLDWLHASETLGHEALDRLIVPLSDRLSLLPSGNGTQSDIAPHRWMQLASYARERSTVVVDVGVLQPGHSAWALVTNADRSIFVTRNCFVGLRRAVGMQSQPDAIVLIHDNERSLNRFDVEAALARPVDVQIPLDPAVARAVDSGLLGGRLPRSLSRACLSLFPLESQSPKRERSRELVPDRG
jgi:hypothetical protein